MTHYSITARTVETAIGRGDSTMNRRTGAVLLVWVENNDPAEIEATREDWEETARGVGVTLLVLVRGTTSVVYTSQHEHHGHRGTGNE